ncbi:hypothetical protein RclHR1_18710002 [Rhizophagus clarus]|uniref:F-box domain-containing protein n=1 Tax=Rhizophagus clarus TaxID=94130 RepID=A0A2Z6QMV5_9GLOM|nr:hypothetical protein RclHR1_18710002 [Rhizophagus clarus]GES79111.1 hypothetical protein GLOIN_2v1881778 [Rhizophagus clarus]
MTCSKIFSGDLPELINEIIQYFRNDFSTLYSCILINRIWCRLTIPLLWENPFSNPTKNYQIIEIYLNEQDKKKLNEYGMNIKIPSSNNNNNNTLFNYPKFIKIINLREIQRCIEQWILMNCDTKKHYTETIIKIIYKSIFQSFINNKANLNTFKISDIKYFNESNSEEIILQNPNFINDIKNLKLNTNQYFKFLTVLTNNCKTISSLYLEFNEIHDIIAIEKYLLQLIKLQKNLEKISFVQKNYLFKQNKFHLHNSLLTLKNSNCSNTLKTIIFYNIDFKNINILKEVFEQLNVLESIHILYCLSLNTDFIQQIINLNKPFKLKSLFLSSRSFQIESFQSLLQKSDNYLENIGFGFFTNNELKQQLLELIIKYCTKIKFFELLGFNEQSILLTFDIIDNIGENLNYLSIDNEMIKLSSIVLRELGQILPNKLEYLKLCLKINPSDFELFLKKSQNTFIKKLLIRDYTTIGSEDILPYIEKYIMKKKRVKYLAFKDDFIGRDLFESKNKVKKFELYGIKVESYHNPNIYVTFIAEMYCF